MNGLSRPGRCAAALAFLAGILVACDPGVGVSARNESDQDVILRDAAVQWSLPAHSSGRVFAQLGAPDSVNPKTYEILDPASCTVLATQPVDFATTADSVIVIRGDHTVALAKPSSDDNVHLKQVPTCPGPAGGWTLWVVNSSSRVFLIRSTGPDGSRQVARIEPSSSGAALRGYDEATTIELLTETCQPLDQAPHKGWGDFSTTVGDAKLSINVGRAAQEPGSYADVKQCT